MPIDPKYALSLLKPDGPLSQKIEGFEVRPEQASMLVNIVEAYNKDEIALIEAGTGTGKSLSYLLPALLAAVHQQERTVISTSTINLQEQLLNKDIPTVAKALNAEIKAVLVKGMSNYVCLNKLNTFQREPSEASLDERLEISRIESWAHTTQDGSRSDLPFAISPKAWEKVCATSDECSYQRCPHYEECHFIKARKKSEDAQILVVNHALLLNDLVRRSNDQEYSETYILPPFKRMVIDEAHHLEDVATDVFSMRLSRLGLQHLLQKILNEKYGKIALLSLKLHQHFKGKMPSELSRMMTFDFPLFRTNLHTLVAKTFDALEELMIAKQQDQVREDKLRLLAEDQQTEFWLSVIKPYLQDLHNHLDQLVSQSFKFMGLIDRQDDEKLKYFSKGLIFELNSLLNRVNAISAFLLLLQKEVSGSSVRWMEAFKNQNLELIEADLDLSQRFVEVVFSKFPTVVLCSATLTTNRSFAFVRSRLGLVSEKCDRNIREQIYDSPFNYPTQALFAITNDVPQPNHHQYETTVAEKIVELVRISRGNAFVLFTSYQMLKNCFDLVHTKLQQERFHLMKQGDASRKKLLEDFRKQDRSILFGTDSFWEGVDVVGDALRCVIIPKLPFKVPTEPIVQGRSEHISAKGGDPFMDYMLPMAIVKFKQGFGRLIRNKSDRGCVICLDGRLLNKSYGRLFLNSLPKCQQAFTDSQTVQTQMTQFYKRK